MGMFDYFSVEQSLIDNLIPHEIGILKRLKEFSEDSKYYYFQTKSLDKFLWHYSLEDAKLFVDKHDYADSGEPEQYIKEHTNFSGSIKFYDYLIDVDGYNIFITFECLIVEGVLHEHHVYSIEKTDIEQLRKEAEEYREKWDKITSSPYWGILKILENLEFFLKRLLKPIILKYNKFKVWLKTKSEQHE